jgi:predicted deacylase
MLDDKALAGSVTVAPIANPLAFAAATRTNPDDGLNLARCFPGKPDGQPTERLAAALFRTLAESADCSIDLHSGGINYLFLPVAGFYGPAEASNPSYQAARHFGLPRLWALPPTNGVLSCELWKRGTIAIGCEYLGAGQLSTAGVAAYKSGILRCMAHWEMLPPTAHESTSQSVLTGDWLLSARDGLFYSFVPVGLRVSAGSLLASVKNVRGETLEEFHAPVSGIVGGLRSKSLIRGGDWAVLLLQETHAA